MILPLSYTHRWLMTNVFIPETANNWPNQTKWVSNSFHLVCTFIIWCLFSSWTKCSEMSLGTVMILPLIHIGDLWLTFSPLKQVILDQSRQNRYPRWKQFHLVCTFIIWCLFSSWSKYSEKSLGTVVILPLSYTHRWLMTNVFSPETGNTWPNQTK